MSDLKKRVEHAVEQYLTLCEGNVTTGLHALIMNEVEQSLIRSVMAHTKGNQTAAADILGISRTTLRKKVQSISDV